MSLMNSKKLAEHARRLESVQNLLSDMAGFKKKITAFFADGMIDKAACQQARIGANHIEEGLRSFALSEEKAYERAGGDFGKRIVSSGGMLRGK